MGFESDFRKNVQVLCQLFECSETSGYRTPKRNTMVGGHPRSRHLEGLAVDIVPDELGDIPNVARMARRLGLYAHAEDDHVHLQAVPPRASFPRPVDQA